MGRRVNARVECFLMTASFQTSTLQYKHFMVPSNSTGGDSDSIGVIHRCKSHFRVWKCKDRGIPHAGPSNISMLDLPVRPRSTPSNASMESFLFVLLSRANPAAIGE